MYHKYVKVLVVFTFDYSLETWQSSGTLEKELKPYKLLNELKNIEFIFLTFGNRNDKSVETKIKNLKIIPAYDIINKTNSKFINYLKSFYLPFKLKNQLKGVDIIKQNQLLGSWVSIVLKQILKKPLIVRTGYDMYEFSIFENKKWTIQKLYKLLTLVSLKASDVYTVSSYCDKTFLKNEFRNEDVLVRPNWVSNYEYSAFNERIKNRVITVGRLENQKNYKYLIESFRNTDFEIDIIGYGSQRNILESFAKDLNVKVNFLDRLNNNEILDRLKDYRYYISTSTYEGNPKSVLEALSVGCVVFASNIKNHKELINDGVNGYLFNLDNDSLRKVFTENYNKENLGKISKNAKNNIYETNSIEKYIEAENSDLQNLL